MNGLIENMFHDNLSSYKTKYFVIDLILSLVVNKEIRERSNDTVNLANPKQFPSTWMGSSGSYRFGREKSKANFSINIPEYISFIVVSFWI